jgi:ribosomal peptide maturation radical SAM protein 1
MEFKQTNAFKKVALISTPWPLYSRPSIQIGTLKAYLKKTFSDLKVDAHHFYLKLAEAIGYRRYQTISKRTWLAETVYAGLLYPERIERIEKIFYRKASGKFGLNDIDFRSLLIQVEAVSENFVRSVDWGGYGLVGFSICMCQLTSSLYFIQQIKKRFPRLRVVVGGSMFSSDSNHTLLKVFPEIDLVINGEGELPLSRLIFHLRNSPRDNPLNIMEIITEESPTKRMPATFNQIDDLSDLPFPDYDDYFELLKSFSAEKTFFPTIPMETSRGCWWRHKKKGGKFKGCAFCNLNLQWEGYRSKKPVHVALEIDHLTERYKTLSVAFMDNLLPLKTSRDMFERIGNLGKDLKLFGEIRAVTPRRLLSVMKAGGMQEVQIGIEALSTHLLEKFNKGTTAIQNIEIMKNCEMLGLVNTSNLIFYFPGSDPKDIDETLHNLEFVMPFRPLKMVCFWLGFGSPVWKYPKDFGLRAVFNHHHYADIFPREIFQQIQFTVQTYRGDLGHQKKLWRPVKKKLKAWKTVYDELHRGSRYDPILSFNDGRSFLIIRQRKFRGDPITHRLEGTSRSIYLFCEKHQSFKRIRDRFPTVAADKMMSFLKMMVDKKLMFQENDQYLSLAVSEKPYFLSDSTQGTA